MLTKRIIPCLDVRDGKLTKGVKFEGNVVIGDPVESARKYCNEGADEIVLYDIAASAENRRIFTKLVTEVASVVTIPLIAGGGLHTLADMRAVLLAGADKVSVNSGAVKNPEIIAEGAAAFGSKAMLVGMDVKQVPPRNSIPSGYEIVIHGGRTFMDVDAVAWAKRCEELGAGEICLNSIDADGTREGYELTLTRMISEAVGIPVIASGGAGKPEHLLEALTQGKASAALVASIVHYGEHTIPELKKYLRDNGCDVPGV